MSKKETVDTYHGKHKKYRVVRDGGPTSTAYRVVSDDGVEAGKFDSRKAANNWVKENKNVD